MQVIASFAVLFFSTSSARSPFAFDLEHLNSISWTIAIVTLVTPLAYLCGILLKIRATIRHLTDIAMVRTDLIVVAIWAVAGILIALPAGWTISRLMLR